MSKRDYYFEPLKRINILLKGINCNLQDSYKDNKSKIESLMANHSRYISNLLTGSEYRSDTSNISQKIDGINTYNRHEHIFNNSQTCSIMKKLRQHILSMIYAQGALRKISKDDNKSIAIKKGQINIHYMRKFCLDREKHKKMSIMFKNWKIAFLEKLTDLEIDTLHLMTSTKRLFKKYRSYKKEKAFVDDQFQIEYERKLVNKCYIAFKGAAIAAIKRRNEVLNEYRIKIGFQRWRKFLLINRMNEANKQRIKRNFNNNLLSKLFHKWIIISKKTLNIRRLMKQFIKNRVSKIHFA